MIDKSQPPYTTASLRRARIAVAARTWIRETAADPTNEEIDLDLDNVLHVLAVLEDNDGIDEIWSDDPETLMIRLDSGTLIEIDTKTGNYLRGEPA